MKKRRYGYKPQETFGLPSSRSDRRCDSVGCITILSMYNEGPFCHACSVRLEAQALRRTTRRSKGEWLAPEEYRLRDDEMRTMFKQGLTQPAIAAVFDVSVSRVAQIVGGTR